MTQPAIHTENLTKTFGTRRAITHVSLEVEPGQVFGFLGPNGAGKSTTIRCLLGLYRPTSGVVRTLGHNPSRGKARFLREVGYLPGELQLPETLTGADVLRRFTRMRGLRDTAFRDELVTRLGVETGRPIRTLSKGNKQKIGLVLAFMHRPRLLILDEPTSGLDPLLQGEFSALVREQATEGVTVLLSSHDLDEVQRTADRVAIIRDGRIVADDTVEALRANAPRTMEVSFDHPVDAARLLGLPGVTVTMAGPGRLSLTHTGPLAPVLTRLAELQPASLVARPADLDELFRGLYATPTTRDLDPIDAMPGGTHAR